MKTVKIDKVSKELAEKGYHIQCLNKLSGGKNSEAFYLDCGKDKFALKIYNDNHVNKRDRLNSVLIFLEFCVLGEADNTELAE